MKKLIILISITLAGMTMPLLSQDSLHLMRFPAIHNQLVVFSYAGDLYTIERKGGIARKLTSDAGYEMFAHISPDGKLIAFSAQYDGNTEVYVIPATGGAPKRLTFTATLDRDDISDRMGPNNIVLTWKDNETIIFRSRKKTFNDFKGQLFAVSTKDLTITELPLPCGGFCSYSTDRTQFAYNRVFREFRTWKYYKGGMADDVWIYDFAKKTIENITNNVAQDIFPMWYKNKIYYISDRDRIMNLFCYDLQTKQSTKITNFTDYDIKFPSLGKDEIIFEKGGRLFVYDLLQNKIEQIKILINNDFVNSRKTWKNVSENIRYASLAPDAKSIMFGARGEIFKVPVKDGITYNLTQTSGVHERDIQYAPDGKWIAFVSDQTGEDELYIQKSDMSEKPIQLTKGADTYKYFMIWSPDSKKIAWADKMLRLQYIDIETKKVTLIDKATAWEFNDYDWSPDSKWLVYAKPELESKTKLYLYNLQTAEKTAITDGWYSCYSPSFSRDGKYLFFVSDRDFKPIYSRTEWNHAYVDMARIYFLSLTKTAPSLLQINEDNKDTSNTKPGAPITMNIDLDGLAGRIAALPIESGNYWNLNYVNGILYYVKSSSRNDWPRLMMYHFKDKKESYLAQTYRYEITPDGKKILFFINNQYAVTNLPQNSGSDANTPLLASIKDFVKLDNMRVYVDLKQEWAQIYQECWRQMKYFFYAPNMHGADWNAVYKKYASLVKYVNHRADLNYLIGEMIGELNCGHAYIGGGDLPKIEKIKMGLLGAELTKDASGFYKINKILKGENWTSNTRSPLTEIGVNAKEGNYIIKINGIAVNTVNNIYELLIHQANKKIELTLNNSPSTTGSWTTTVTTIDDEAGLFYYNWVQSNIDKVSKASNGEIGYLHIPDMGVDGLNEFVKYYYPQMRKKALIVDVRGNGGGNVSPMIAERLNRAFVMMKIARNSGFAPSPSEVFIGPKTCLIDNYSASDGDLFPYRFKQMKLGKIIGVRSWGGVVGIRGSLPLIDGGSLSKPEFAHYDINGKEFIIEGHGVDPDIVIDNHPAKEYEGIDEQLNKAIDLLKEELKKNNYNLPPAPDYPDKSK